MLTVLKSLFSLSMVFWIGGLFFFSFVAAPSIFKVLSRETAGDVVGDIFPKYYMLSYVCGAVALTSSIALWFLTKTQKSNAEPIIMLILVAMLGLSVYAGQVIGPKANAAKFEVRSLNAETPEHNSAKLRFAKLHRQSVLVNILVFIMGIAIIIITAYTYKH